MRAKLFTVAAVCAGVFWGAAAAPAQLIGLSDSALDRLGLEIAWQTQVGMDTARGRIAHVTTDLNGTNALTVFDVVDSAGTRIKSFHAGLLDPKGRVVDRDGARRLADLEVRILQELGTEATVHERIVPDMELFIQTDAGTLEAIDAETGQTRWRLTPGNRRYPSEKPGVNDQYTAIVNGSTLYLYDIQSDKIAWETTLGGAPGAGAIVGDRRVFVPLLSGVVEYFHLGDRPGPKGRLASSGRAMIQPTLSPNSLSWGTDKGILHGVDPATGVELFRYETSSDIVSRSVYLAPNRLLVATVDGYVHCLHEKSGSLMWRFSAGEPVRRPPLIVDDGVFVATDHGSLFRLDAQTGRQIWWTGGVYEVLSAGEEQLYGRDRAGNLVVLAIDSGVALGTVPVRRMNLSVFNSLTDRVYLGTDTGRLVCLRPQGKTWPTLHVAAQQELDAAQAKLNGDAADTERPAARVPSPGRDPEAAEPASEPLDDDNLFGEPADPASLFGDAPPNDDDGGLDGGGLFGEPPAEDEQNNGGGLFGDEF